MGEICDLIDVLEAKGWATKAELDEEFAYLFGETEGEGEGAA